MEPKTQIPVVDIFAGAGGLGDGFEAYGRAHGGFGSFSVTLSAEMDASAVATLRTRAYFRSFAEGLAPASYYDYAAGLRPVPWSDDAQEQKCWDRASSRACQIELGRQDDDRLLDERIGEIARSAHSTGRPWVLVGGPPCQAYSIVGRARNRGIHSYSPEDDHRHYLYRHYLHILSKHVPAAFVLENVKGMLTAQVHGQYLFDEIIEQLQRPGGRRGPQYRIVPLLRPQDEQEPSQPQDFVVRCEQVGLPQRRHRVILVGLLEELQRPLGPLSVVDVAPTVAEMISDLPRIRSACTDSSVSSWPGFSSRLLEECANIAMTVDLKTADELHACAELARASSDPGVGATWLKTTALPGLPAHLKAFMVDQRLNGVLHHQSRAHMRSDLMRYAFASAFARAHNRSPRGAAEFPLPLYPDHRSWSQPGRFVDRFKVQRASVPSSTITSHLAKDGHYFIHFDPCQVRSLTVREAARLQTFPENYIFEGKPGAQRRQVGNAVPPWLGRQIAGAIHEALR